MIITSILAGGLLFAATPSTPISAMSTEDLTSIKREEFMKRPVEERRAILNEITMRKYGGLITKEGSGKGFVRVVNSQKRVPLTELDRPVSTISKAARVRYELKDGEAVTVETATAARKKLGDGVAIFVVDNAAYPALLPAPEEGWALVNVAPLAADNPEADKLARRLRKECSRAYAYVAGAATQVKGGAALYPVASLSDIDALQGDLLPREAIVRFEPQLKLFGVESYVSSSYRVACQNGWAPAPTNDYQKAIWNEIHAIPEAPLPLEKPAK